MWHIFTDFITDFFESLLNDMLTDMEAVLGDLLHNSYFIEDLPGLDQTVLTRATVNKAMSTIYWLLIILLMIKFLWKGLKVYVLWRDGEAETDPMEMVLGAVLALLTAVGFPVVYQFFAKFSGNLVTDVCNAMFAGSDIASGNITHTVMDGFLTLIGAPFSMLGLGLVFSLLYLWLQFAILKQGVELLIFRMGVPIAAAGLIDSDGGVWKSYCMVFVRQIITVMIRQFCIFLGMRLVSGMQFMGSMLGIACLMVAISTPTLLNQFLSPRGAGGATQKISVFVSAARLFGGK